MSRWALSALFLGGCFYISEKQDQARWDLDGDGVERPADCDDSDPALQVAIWFVDADLDGYGGEQTVEACEAPEGAVAMSGDCDDADLARSPDAAEICNGLDDDCDDDVDEGATPPTWYPDLDGDLFGDMTAAVAACEAPPNHVADGSDCDDSSDGVNPDAQEVCNDVDDDCDEAVDFDDEDLPLDGLEWFPDGDGDGYGDAATTPVLACAAPLGYGPPEDCDDDRPLEAPGNEEVCDGLDNDCNGSTDGADATDAPTWFEDYDGDGFGDGTSTRNACTQPDGYVSNFADCDDQLQAINPLAVEICDGDDNNCDTFVDEGC